jgi:DNA modification methylase
MNGITILQGDALEVLKTMPDESVHCVLTSPPYWRQRDYKMAGQVGLEETPEEYTQRLVEIFREARRALALDGTFWLNIGEKWASGGNGGGGSFMDERKRSSWSHAKDSKGWRSPPPGYKDKDMVGIPWMVAFALRADGWHLRQCNVWAKPNGMPESVSDRSTVSHEYVFHLTKNNDYWYDDERARTPPAPSSETRLAQDAENQIGSLRANGRRKTNGNMKAVARRSDKQRGHSRKHEGFNDRCDAMEKSEQQQSGANLRSVWWISPAQTTDEHYAVMPDKLAKLCIIAGCKPGGTVLDPFGGSGTTALVARANGCKAILIELNPDYIKIAERRLAQEHLEFSEVTA